MITVKIAAHCEEQDGAIIYGYSVWLAGEEIGGEVVAKGPSVGNTKEVAQFRALVSAFIFLHRDGKHGGGYPLEIISEDEAVMDYMLLARKAPRMSELKRLLNRCDNAIYGYNFVEFGVDKNSDVAKMVRRRAKR